MKIITIEQFRAEIIATIDKVSGEFTVEPVTVVKTNDQQLYGLVFKDVREPNAPQPTIYLNSAYQEYLDGLDLNCVVNEILGIYACAKMDKPREDQIPKAITYSEIKDKLRFRLLEEARNKEFLRSVPNVTVGNGLVLVCEAVLAEDENGCFSVVINNEWMDKVDCSKAKLFGQCMMTCYRNNPPVLMDLETLPDKTENLLLTGNRIISRDKVFVLSNKARIHGASVIFYPGLLETIADLLGEWFYVLPASVHEVMIVPMSSFLTIGEMASAVIEGNATVNTPAEVLSNRLFKFEEGKLEDISNPLRQWREVCNGIF